MKTSTVLFLGLLVSCGQKVEEKKMDFQTFDLSVTNKVFEKQIQDHIAQWNSKNNDSVTQSLVRDSTFIFQIDKSNIIVVLSQYQTSDKRKKFGILSIENFGLETTPTYLLSNDKADKYLGDSVELTSDNLMIYGRILTTDKTESFKISFDIKFDGKTFPWDLE